MAANGGDSPRDRSFSNQLAEISALDSSLAERLSEALGRPGGADTTPKPASDAAAPSRASTSSKTATTTDNGSSGGAVTTPTRPKNGSISRASDFETPTRRLSRATARDSFLRDSLAQISALDGDLGRRLSEHMSSPARERVSSRVTDVLSGNTAPVEASELEDSLFANYPEVDRSLPLSTQLQSAMELLQERDYDLEMAGEIGQMLLSKNTDLERTQESLTAELSEKDRDMKHERILGEEKQAFLEERLNERELEIEKLTETLEQSRQETEQLGHKDADIQKVQTELEITKQQLAQSEKALTEAKEKVTKLKAKKTEQIDTIQELRDALIKAEGQLEYATDDIERLKNEIKSSDAKTQSVPYLEKDIRALKEENDRLQKIAVEKESLQKLVNKFTEMNTRLQKQSSEDRALLNDSRRTVESLRKTLRETKHVNDTHAAAADTILKGSIFDELNAVADQQPLSPMPEPQPDPAATVSDATEVTADVTEDSSASVTPSSSVSNLQSATTEVDSSIHVEVASPPPPEPTTPTPQPAEPVPEVKAEESAAGAEGRGEEEEELIPVLPEFEAHREFFYLTCMAIRVRHDHLDDLLTTSQLYEVARDARVPFHQWYPWIEQRLLEASDAVAMLEADSTRNLQGTPKDSPADSDDKKKKGGRKRRGTKIFKRMLTKLGKKDKSKKDTGDGDAASATTSPGGGSVGDVSGDASGLGFIDDSASVTATPYTPGEAAARDNDAT